MHDLPLMQCMAMPLTLVMATMITIDKASATTMKSGTATAMVSVGIMTIAVATVNVKAVIHDKTSTKTMENAMGDSDG